MCGIGSIFTTASDDGSLQLLQDFCELQQHRGPDAQAVLDRFPVLLGHTRLSIIDRRV